MRTLTRGLARSSRQAVVSLRRHHLLLATAVLVLSACGGARPVSPGRTAIQAARAVEATVTTVGEHEGQVLVELPLGKASGLEPGQLLRVIAADDPNRIKGMIQVSDVLGEDRSVARMIGLLDRASPLAPGDRVVLVRDLSDLAGAGEVERGARAEQADLEATRSAELRAFDRQRQAFERELADLRRAHARELERLGQEQTTALQTAEERHRRELARKEAERQADLGALRATLTDEARTALREDARTREARIRELETQASLLQRQIAALAEERLGLQNRVTALVAAEAALRAAQQRELRAEAETRQVLEERIRTLEARIGGLNRPGRTVLPSDPERSETVLQRLERLEAERATLAARAAELEEDGAHLRRQFERAQARSAELEVEVQTLRGSRSSDEASAARLLAVETELARLREHGEAVEIGRLRAEREYFELVGRIIRLGNSTAALSELQQQLRRSLTAEERR